MISSHVRSRQPARDAWPRDRLLRERAIALGLAIDTSTLKTYSSALNSYLTFVRLHDLPVEPTPDTLSFFVVFMSHHIEPRSVKSYLSGICQQLEPYFPNVRASRHTPLVERTMKGSLRLKSSPIKRKRALTLSDLSKVLNETSHSNSHDDKLFRTMLLTDFFALMRLGELSFPNDVKLRNWKKVTKRSSVSVSDEQYEFHLPSHKADPFFEGNHIIVKKKQYSNINPLLFFQEYIASRDSFSFSFTFMAHIERKNPNSRFLHKTTSTILLQRHSRSIHESWRRHIPCGKRCPSFSHPTHRPLVFRRLPHLHSKKPYSYSSSLIFANACLIFFPSFYF